jgi:hypothetical protein
MSDQSPLPHPVRHILLLSSHLHLGLPSGLFPCGFPTKILYPFLFSPMHATCPVHLILLHFIIIFTVNWGDFMPVCLRLCHVHESISYITSAEDLPEQWKESSIVPIPRRAIELTVGIIVVHHCY